MLKQLAMLSLVFSTAFAGVNSADAKLASAAGKCIGDCNTDSLLYICLKNTTQKSVYVRGESDSTNFLVEAAPGGRYWYWFRRPRNDDRTLKVYLNGQADDARYNWTSLTPSQLGGDQACFFNKWEVKEKRDGSLYLRKAS